MNNVNEVKRPRKPLMIFYLIVIGVIVLFNLVLLPMIKEHSIELVDYDIDIIASYSRALHGDSLAFICAGDGVEFPT